MKPQPWHTLIEVFEIAGFAISRESQPTRLTPAIVAMERLDCKKPVLIPKIPSVHPAVIRSNLRTANISEARYHSILQKIQ